MHPLTYKDITYRSIAQACEALGLSYPKVRRYCRHYVRARRDPALAVAWCAGEEQLLPTEAKTPQYHQDAERGALRQIRFKDRATGAFFADFR